ncbi:hypothetical protein HDU67_000457, partial [Dinochytrium kinnereticum]
MMGSRRLGFGNGGDGGGGGGGGGVGGGGGGGGMGGEGGEDAMTSIQALGPLGINTSTSGVGGGGGGGDDSAMSGIQALGGFTHSTNVGGGGDNAIDSLGLTPTNATTRTPTTSTDHRLVDATPTATSYTSSLGMMLTDPLGPLVDDPSGFMASLTGYDSGLTVGGEKDATVEYIIGSFLDSITAMTPDDSTIAKGFPHLAAPAPAPSAAGADALMKPQYSDDMLLVEFPTATGSPSSLTCSSMALAREVGGVAGTGKVMSGIVTSHLGMVGGFRTGLPQHHHHHPHAPGISSPLSAPAVTVGGGGTGPSTPLTRHQRPLSASFQPTAGFIPSLFQQQQQQQQQQQSLPSSVGGVVTVPSSKDF